MLHVDAKGDTGSLLKDTLDDVVITSQGRIGIGALNPQTRLDIVSPTAGAVRIEDPTAGGGKVLVSDAGGRVSWTNISGSWYAALTGGWIDGASTGTNAELWPPFRYTDYEIYPPETGSADSIAGKIVVPYTGSYRISITGKAFNSIVNSPEYLITYMKLWINSYNPMNPHINSLKSFGWVDFGFAYIYSLNAKDTVWIEPFRTTSGISSYSCNEYQDTILQLEFLNN
jgi:hypothetical protein